MVLLVLVVVDDGYVVVAGVASRIKKRIPILHVKNKLHAMFCILYINIFKCTHGYTCTHI